MSEKVSVVYIGEKDVKRIVLTGRKHLFPQGKPVALNAEDAYHLLEFDTVFATPEAAEERVKEIQANKDAEEKRKKAIEENNRTQVIQDSFVVIVDGENIDISKFTTAKLKTVIEAEELAIEHQGVQLATLRVDVRNALHAKHGNPELDGE